MATLDDIEGPADMEPKHLRVADTVVGQRQTDAIRALRQAIQWFKGVDAIRVRSGPRMLKSARGSHRRWLQDVRDTPYDPPP